jgi:acetoin utilization deacetylase AcuC-like enzyme
MRIFFSEEHRRHFPQAELHGGQFVTPFERPSRVEFVLARLKDRGFDDIVAPGDFDPSPVAKVHDAGYLKFLATAWEKWTAAGYRGEIIPACFPIRRMRNDRPPADIDGQAGYYAFAAETAITAGTWAAAAASCSSAEAAARYISSGAHAAFALCRPPGHHAGIDHFGGYCFLNNAAVAAQTMLDGGARKAAVLDVDFHHGNGTQDIFYRRGDVFIASIHGRPEDAFPHFLGFADETGEGEGEHTNLNLPLPPGTGAPVWFSALDHALTRIEEFGAEALVVSLGVDAFRDDPISFFKLSSDDFTRCGARIAHAGLPTVFVLEGGYAVEAIGVNVVNALEGFLGR